MIPQRVPRQVQMLEEDVLVQELPSSLLERTAFALERFQVALLDVQIEFSLICVGEVAMQTIV